MQEPGLAEILALEEKVWEALVTGDAARDAALLDAHFLGLYETGFGDRDEHVAQLADGPTVAGYRLCDARLMPLAEGLVLLAYRAEYVRVGTPEVTEAMWVSSIWNRGAAGWKNLFSQDTPAGDRRPV